MARETATYLHCDYHGCNVSVAVADSQEAPEGWYRVYSAHDGKYHRDSWEFHSLRCMERWGEERRKSMQPIGVVRNTNGAAATAAPTTIELLRELFQSDASAILTSPELRELTGRSQTVVYKALGVLVDDGFIERNNNAPRQYWLAVPE